MAVCLLAGLLPALGAAAESPSASCHPVNAPSTAESTKGWVVEIRDLDSVLPAPRPNARFPDCLITPREAADRVASGDAVLVDVRRPEEFDQVRIPGSINIPLNAVASRRFLAGRTLILVDRGFSHAALGNACRSLRSKGNPRAYVLAAGLVGWRTAGGALDGDPFAVRELGRVTAKDVVAEQQTADWTLVLPNEPLPGSKAAALRVRRGYPGRDLDSPSGPAIGMPTRFLLASEDGTGYEGRTEPAATRAARFYLDGGIDAYRAYLTGLNAMLTHPTGQSGASRCH